MTDATAARASSATLIVFCALVGLFEGPAEIACAAALVATVATGGMRGGRLNLADVGLLVWLAAGLVGALGGYPKLGSEPNLRPLLALAYVLGRTAIAGAEPKLLAHMGLAFMLGTSVNALFGVVQVLLFEPGLERWIIGRNRAAHLETGDGRLKMATGLFYNRMKLVHVGVIALSVACIGLADARRRQVGRARLVGLLAIGLVIASGVLLTYRRAAPAALVMSLGLLAIAMGRAKLAALVAALGGGALGLMSLVGYGRERLDTASVDLGQRVEMWVAAQRLIGDHALVGVGHGGYGRAIGPYLELASSADVVKNALTNPHNVFLHVLTETGVVGFSGFALAVGSSLAAVVVSVGAERADASPRASLDRVALVGLITVLTIGVVHAVLHHAPVALLFWTMLGVASARLPALRG